MLQGHCAVYLIQLFFFADNLLFVINSIKQEIVNRVQVPKDDRGGNMEQKLNILIKDTLGKQSSQCICISVERHVIYDTLDCKEFLE